MTPNPPAMGDVFTGQQASRDATIRNNSNVPAQVVSVGLSTRIPPGR